MPAPGIPPAIQPNVSPASGNVLSNTNASIYQTLVAASQAAQGISNAASATQTAATSNKPAKPLFETIFGIDLTSAMFVVVGVVVVVVALNIFFAQAARAAAPVLLEGGKAAVKLAAV